MRLGRRLDPRAQAARKDLSNCRHLTQASRRPWLLHASARQPTLLPCPQSAGCEASNLTRPTGAFLAWRGGVIYEAYKQLGGHKRWKTMASQLLMAAPNPAEYANVAAAYIDALLAAEGHGPIPGGPLLVHEWASTLTVNGWRAVTLQPGPLQATHFCWGRPGEPCRFSMAESGARARYQAGSWQQCAWCSESWLAQAMAAPNGRRTLTRGLTFFWRNNTGVFWAARSRLPESVRTWFPLRALGLPPAFHTAEAAAAATSTPQGRGRCVAEMEAKMIAEPRRARQARARTDAAAAKKSAWDLRRRLRAPPAVEEAEVYQARVAEDRARVQRKFFPTRKKLVKHSGWRWEHSLAEEIRAAADVAPNDTGLPKATCDLAAALEGWCKLGSWAVCAACGSVEPRRLQEIDLRRVALSTTPHCSNCRVDGPTSVHCVSQTPRALRA